jgi:hypothetical protein
LSRLVRERFLPFDSHLQSIFATIAIHGPLVRDPVARADQIVHMIKNIAIVGGLFNFVVF